MKKAVMYFNEGRYLHELNEAETFARNAQRVVDFHYELGDLFPLTTLKQVHEIITGGGAKAYKRLLLETIPLQEVVRGVTVKREIQLQQLDFPDMSKLDAIVGACHEKYAGFYSCKLNNKTVVVDEDAKAALRNSYTYAADSKDMESFFEAHKEAAAALNKLNKLIWKANRRDITHDGTYRALFSIDDSGNIKYRNTFYEKFRFPG